MNIENLDFNEEEGTIKTGRGRPKKPGYNVQVPVKLKEIEYSACVPLRLDHKTIIFVKPGTDLEKTRAKFENREADNKEKTTRTKGRKKAKLEVEEDLTGIIEDLNDEVL